jgi:hypothetical protein
MNTALNKTSTTHRAARNQVAQSVYEITLKVPAGADDVRLLRASLKVLLRRFGLRCLHIEQVRR